MKRMVDLERFAERTLAACHQLWQRELLHAKQISLPNEERPRIVRAVHAEAYLRYTQRLILRTWTLSCNDI